MIKVLQDAIEKVKKLPQERQAYAAEVLEQIVATDGGQFQIPDDHIQGVLEGLAEAERGELASDEEVEAVLRKPWSGN